METFKCILCKEYLTIDAFNTNKNGERMKRCVQCNENERERKLCEHGRYKDRCTLCGDGSGLCQHSRRKNRCTICANGSGLCEHNRDKHTCTLCRTGNSLCEHNRRKDRCTICGDGTTLCQHGRRKHTCTICGTGGGVCEHGKNKCVCKICNPLGHLRAVVSNAVYCALKGNKSTTGLDYLGCESIEFYKEYLENQFEDDMTWDNYGELWEIDHKVPIFYNNPTEEEVIERLVYTNTQPLYASDNRSKGNRYAD